MESGAEFSKCKKYRFALWRIWDESKPFIMFIGLNPSTANETDNDATVRRVISFSKNWGYGGVYMMNCFPFISTDPSQLKDTGNIALNDKWLNQIGLKCIEVVFAWGKFEIVKSMKRDLRLKQIFPNAKALIKNKDGSPRHPLYVASNTELINF